MNVFALAAALSLFSAFPSWAADAIDDALSDAIAAFGRAAPQLPAVSDGVDVGAYGEALSTGRFTAPYWGATLGLDLVESGDSSGSCGRFAAFVRLPPQDGRVQMVICPQFVSEGTASLRRLTILHEMVHVVAGPDECRAMAFAARIEFLASGSFTPVERYWQANNCPASGLSLPG